MKYRLKQLKWLLFAASLMICMFVNAQENSGVKGSVASESGELLQGVTVVASGTGSKEKRTAVTNDKGLFVFTNLKAGISYTFNFSFVGYNDLVVKDYLVKSSDNNSLLVRLKAAGSHLDDMVVIGYGSQSKSKITGSIEKITNSQIKDVPGANFAYAMMGKAAGVQVSQNTGAPGAGLSFKVRGINTLTSGTQPLYVIDGIPLFNSANALSAQAANGYSGYTVDMLSAINTNDIESIEVLKDAASQAIYGSRGSNGVVLITTKSGKGQGKNSITFDSYVGTQQLGKKIKVADAYEFANFNKLSRDNLWVSYNPAVNKASDANDSINNANARYPDYVVPYLSKPGLPGTDWQDVVYRKAMTQNYNLAFSSELEKSSYYISASYLDEEGIIRNSGMKRYGARINYQTEVNNVVSFGTNMNLSYVDNKLVQSEGAWGNEGVVITTLMYAPNLPAYRADGSIALGDMLRTSLGGQSNVALIENPLALTEGTKNVLTQTSLLANAFVTVKLAKNLKFKTYIGTNLNFNKHNYYRSKYLNYQKELAPTTASNIGWENVYIGKNLINENSLNYTTVFGRRHSIDVLLDYSVQKDNNERTYAQGINFANDNVHSINAALTSSSTSDASASSLISYIGRVAYSYGNKYLLSASLRRDGSSRFGNNSKWGVFPSASAGWNISEESFFPKTPVISNLKLRVSYGLTGNNDISNYGSQALLSVKNYVLGNTVVSGLSQSTSPNPDISWEKTKQFNLGINASLLRNRISIIADYFTSQTDDLLLNVTLPASSGFSSSLQNIGKIENKGVEFTINGNLQIGAVSWSPSFNISTTKNKVLSLANNQSKFSLTAPNGGLAGDSYIVKVGESIGNFYGYNVIGIFKNTQQLNAYPHLSNNLVGDFIYEDVNRDGKLNADDRTIIGNYLPKYTFGFSNTFNYKNFDLNIIIQGAQHFSVLNAMNRYLFEGWGNVFQQVAVGSFVSETDPGTGAPRPAWSIGSNDHTTLSSWHIEDASYIRFRNITLGYTLPLSLAKRASISSVRFYVSALNPVTITSYQGYNPEVSHNSNSAVAGGEDFGNYPIAKSFVLGIHLKF